MPISGARSDRRNTIGWTSIIVENTQWKKLEPDAPHYFSFRRDTQAAQRNIRGWKEVTDMMPLNGWGIATRKDYLLVDFELNKRW